MASLDECRVAVGDLAKNLAGASDDERRGLDDRTLSLHVPDLEVTFAGRLEDGLLVDITEAPRERAQIRFTIKSDDLIALTEGKLAMVPAWMSGRIKVDASFRDLLKLRALM